MSFFNLFGNKKEKKIPPHKVIMNIKETLSALEKKETFLESRIIEYKTEARSHVKKNKSKAISLLKKAKMNEKQLDSIYEQKNSLETQILVIEQGINDKNIVSVMKQGKSTLEQMTKSMDPDDIAELMDDIASSMDMASAVSDALSAPVGPVYDDDELLEELEKDGEEEKEKMLKELMVDPELSDLPVVPNNHPEKEKVSEDEELTQLEKMMAI